MNFTHNMDAAPYYTPDIPLILKQCGKTDWISKLLTKKRNNKRKKAPEEWCCAFPESSYTRILPRAALCEMECEMSALNIPAVDYTHYLTPGFESILPPAWESVINSHSPLLTSFCCSLRARVCLFNQATPRHATPRVQEVREIMSSNNS